MWCYGCYCYCQAARLHGEYGPSWSCRGLARLGGRGSSISISMARKTRYSGVPLSRISLFYAGAPISLPSLLLARVSTDD
jgi:hypothetical protein